MGFCQWHRPLVQGIARHGAQSGRAGGAAGQDLVCCARAGAGIQLRSDILPQTAGSRLLEGVVFMMGCSEDKIQGSEQWWRMARQGAGVVATVGFVLPANSPACGGEFAVGSGERWRSEESLRQLSTLA